MTDKKKVVGVYLPPSLIERITRYLCNLFLKKGIKKRQSEFIQEAIENHLDEEEPRIK
jgi:metal-responsive CopG/Arc/MetJ family transcriptional regulator